MNSEQEAQDAAAEAQRALEEDDGLIQERHRRRTNNAVRRSDLRTSQREPTRTAAPHGRVRLRKGGQQADKFDIPADQIPEGWSYEWKRMTVLGQADPSYDLQMAEQGWTPVEAKRHPKMMPPKWTQGHIERDGLILMERPVELTKEAQAEHNADAREAIELRKRQMSDTPAGTFTRDHPSARRSTFIRTERVAEQVQIPE